ncbi:MAG TPA: sialate O-acetylesterase, partial [Candidatus Saccharimonadia bacterium]|nr:sialate O-acetylesterase [Candidatus Saccharimonadia bacterium]
MPWSAGAQSLPSKDKLHLYLLIGQSNMAGRGVVEEQDRQANARVLTFSKDNTWAPAVDPIHFDKPIAGVGLGTTFGKVMAEANPGVTIGLVPCAVGGTPLDRWQKDKDLYEQALVRIKAAMKDGTL